MCAPAPSRRCDDPACPLCTAGILPRPDLTEPVSGRAYQDLQEILAIATRRLHEVEDELRAARPVIDQQDDLIGEFRRLLDEAPIGPTHAQLAERMFLLRLLMTDYDKLTGESSQ